MNFVNIINYKYIYRICYETSKTICVHGEGMNIILNQTISNSYCQSTFHIYLLFRYSQR